MTSRPHLLVFQSRDDGLFYAAHLQDVPEKGWRIISRVTDDPEKAIKFATEEDACQAHTEAGSPPGWKAVPEA